MKDTKFKFRLYGRNKGRTKIDNSSIDILNSYRLDIKKNFLKSQFNILDIGSGNGENAISLSHNNPNAQIIACEVYKDGNVNLCKKIKNANISNIRLFEGNVLELLDNIKKISIFNEVWILFPDPWPKNRHHKRRLINKNFIAMIHFFLKNNGKLFIASDSASYNKEIIKLIYEVRSIFLWQNQKFCEWDYDILDLPRTRFYKKALKSSRKSMFFKLFKI